MKYVPNKGDIVHLDFDPSSGNEMKGPHFGLVLSSRKFNSSGLAMVCPISQGLADKARSHGFMVSLMGAGTETAGNIHCHQLKSLDWQVRKAKLKERAPDFITEDALARIQAILFDV